MPTIKGTASVADSRARQKALKKTKFSKSFGKSVSLEKVNKPVLTQWIEQKITSILGFEDEIVSSTAINLFLPSDNSSPDPKKAQLDLTGFLGEQAVSFSSELWKLMLEAQASSSGIPQTLLEQKKKEIEERMARENKSQQQTVKQEVVARNQKQNGSGTNQLPPERQSSSNKHDNRNNNSNAARGDPPQFQRDKRNGPPADANGHGTDQFGRAHPPQRPRNNQRPAPRDQYDRNRPSDFEASRRGPRRSRSRERYDYDRDRDYRRRPDDRRRPMNYDQRRPDDRRYDSNRHDDRSAYHHNHHRRPEYHDHDRYRDGEGWRHRQHNYDREMDDLERRLAHLKQQHKKSDNRTMQRIDHDIRNVQDRIYELERHRRRSGPPRDNYSRPRSRRSRSPSYEHRRDSRRRRSNSSHSERSASSQRSRGSKYSTDSGGSDRGSRNSYSPSPDRSKRNKSRDSPKRHRRRRSRSYSSSEGSEHSK